MKKVEPRADAETREGSGDELEINRDPFCRGAAHTSARGPSPEMDLPVVDVSDMLGIAAGALAKSFKKPKKKYLR